MVTFTAFGREIKLHPLDIFFVAFVFVYVLYTYQPWLSNQCIATVTADLNGHFSNAMAYFKHFSTYHWLYPVDFSLDNDGTSWFYLLPLPYLIPYVVSFFVPKFLAFYLTFALFHAFLVLSVYLFLRNFCDRLIAVLFAGALLVGPIINLNVTVGGHYHFVIGLTFFVLAMHFFYRFTQKSSQRNLVVFTVSYLFLGMTHFYPFFYFTLFAFIYIVWKRLWRFLLYFCFVIGVLSVFTFPVFIQQLNLQLESSSSTSFSKVLADHVLPSTLTSWIYHQNDTYDVHRDQNHGPNMYIAGVLALFVLLFMYKDKSSAFKFIMLYFLLMLALAILPRTPLMIKHPERLAIHLYYSVFFLAAYAASRIKPHPYVLAGVLVLGALATADLLSLSQFSWYLILIVPSAVYLFRSDTEAFTLNKNLRNMFLSAALLFLLIFPLTGKTETTTLDPRLSSFTLEGIEKVIAPADTFFYQGGFGMGKTILGCSGAPSVAGGAHTAESFDRKISGESEIDIYNTSRDTLATLDFKRVNKLIIPVELVHIGNDIDGAKIRHLLEWFGQPQIFLAYFQAYNQGKFVGKSPYPLLVFSRTVPPSDYTITMRTPIDFEITKSAAAQSLLVNIEYNKIGWIATADGKKLTIQNRGGQIFLNNVGGIEKVTLKYYMFPFHTGIVLSIISLIVMVYLLRKRFVLKNRTS